MKSPTNSIPAVLIALGLAACGGGTPTVDSGMDDHVVVMTDEGVRIDTGADVSHEAGQGNCTGVTDCTACAALPRCGWCAGTHQCLLTGTDLSRSADTTCTGANWDPYGATCTGPGSLTAMCTAGGTSCGACLSTSLCGWCGTTNTCAPTNVAGNGSFDGTCTGSAWAPSSLDCLPFERHDGGGMTDAAGTDASDAGGAPDAARPTDAGDAGG